MALVARALAAVAKAGKLQILVVGFFIKEKKGSNRPPIGSNKLGVCLIFLVFFMFLMFL